MNKDELYRCAQKPHEEMEEIRPLKKKKTTQSFQPFTLKSGNMEILVKDILFTKNIDISNNFNFKITEFIGGMNYCLLFKAESEKYSIALKIVSKENEHGIMNEIECQNMNLKNIVKIYSIFEGELCSLPEVSVENSVYQERILNFEKKSCYFILMKQYETSLKKLVREKPEIVTEKFLVNLATSLLQSVISFQERNVVHNGLLPDKILIQDDDIVVSAFEKAIFDSSLTIIDLKSVGDDLAEIYPILRKSPKFKLRKTFEENYQIIFEKVRKFEIDAVTALEEFSKLKLFDPDDFLNWK
jgi:serine/threonine protein kinase